MGSENSGLKVFMFPWLAYGHISPFLELAKRFSERNLDTYICSTPVNLNSIKTKIPEKYSHSIQLVELHLPSSPELPPHYHTTNGLPLHLQPTLRKALKMARPNLSNILKTLHPDLLIHDVMYQWAAAFSLSHNIPAISFSTSGATTISYFCHTSIKPGTEYPFPAIRLTDFEKARIDSHVKDHRKETEEEDPDDKVTPEACKTTLMKSSREIEGKYMDYLSEMVKREILPVGALFPDPVSHNEENELMEWLGKKKESSSVFVSFGSEYYLKKEEIEEIAYGLELSNVNFIWVIRFPAGENIRVEEALPEGFLKRIGERGRVVEGWAPQAQILGHSSIGGFVSHCGWGSMIESIEFGVPIIAMPMHLDQPLNAKLVVELGIGVEVARDEKGRLQREKIAKVIKDVVIGTIGQNTRRKVREQRDNTRLRSKEEMDGVVQKLAQLCGKNTGKLPQTDDGQTCFTVAWH
ncbi:beta-D-glucosyl crocetin beta-1,6-glucosyltransferase-like [Olea europaea subsp. europaea]|uniref:Glycosyltransferase n=1 Tax=Olea europaea subsp. europaea TaxID=158383 RepID=A0A8S0VG13_OLEEU|nr:beta-D-glucosyl crocetin beta-1,6-glucosyltransferase-like [Olea europaea subsp. europaea]